MLIMSYEGQDPNQQSGQPNTGNYGGYYTPPQPQPTDPYGGQSYGQYGAQGSNQQPPYGQQQPPYGQQGYQQPPYGQQQGFSTGTTSLGLSQNIAAVLGYVFLWVGGLIIFFVEKQNRFVRFHAMQSVIFFGSLSIAVWLVGILAWFPLIGFLFGLLHSVLIIAGIIGWIVLVINAYQGNYFKLPYIGDYAEKYAN